MSDVTVAALAPRPLDLFLRRQAWYQEVNAFRLGRATNRRQLPVGLPEGHGVEQMAAFIYLCNMTTEGECLDRMLFGTNAADSYSGLDVGDRVFLYNYELGILRGPFRATTKSTPNLEPGAWKKSRRRFPWQIRVDGSDALKTPLRADDVAAIIPLSQTKVGLLPPLELTDKQAEQLLSAMSGIQ